MLAPIGRGFTPDPARPRLLALGGGVGIPPMIFLADQFRARPELKPLVLMGSEVPFPFELVDVATRGAGGVGRSNARGRACSSAGACRRGSRAMRACRAAIAVTSRTSRARGSQAFAGRARADVQVFACGPTPMLAAVAKLAREFDLPCQLALEEFMACGIGGCAGCNVLVQTADGPAMKRVCVDGPVFDAREVYPA